MSVGESEHSVVGGLSSYKFKQVLPVKQLLAAIKIFILFFTLRHTVTPSELHLCIQFQCIMAHI